MKLILNTASLFGEIYGIIGCLHAFEHFDLFRNMKLICPTHCTQNIKKIRDLYPDTTVRGGAGKIITI